MSEKRPTARQKQAVAARALGCCEYCRSQVRFAMQPFSAEHILPRQQGGTNTLDNLALSCQGCNNHKYTKTEWFDSINGNLVALFNPRKQNWSEHFAWNNDYTLVIGLTSVGRATVEALQLNREGLVNLRRVLYGAGEHPPEKLLPEKLLA
jgi:hypothetical protein